MSENSTPVFIIGCPRTGSKIYLNAISNYTKINISPELHILNPSWLHPDFVRTVKKQIGSLHSKEAKEKLLTFIEEERFYGSFWHMDRVNISSLRSRLINNNWTVQEIFEKILIEDAENDGRARIGAKFPVHFSRLDKLYEWFPDCKVLHITRDPRAIYNSQLFKYYNRETNMLKKQALRATILLYIIFIYKWDYRIHKKFSNNKNYILSKYEDVVLDFDTQMKKICNYINVKFDSKMKSIPLKDSSFSENKFNEGINTDSLDRFRSTLTTFEIKTIEFFCHKEMSARDYL
ncbi:MAG TPA: sulfotransferase [Chitinophagaceae bacterium]|nr:sulfotransferase [Chitinophagaceae bacterium]